MGISLSSELYDHYHCLILEKFHYTVLFNCTLSLPSPSQAPAGQENIFCIYKFANSGYFL